MTHTGSSAFALENAALKVELGRLRALCGRAADALEEYGWYVEGSCVEDLLAELRKAAG